jgi:hypothetical protein
MAGLGPPNTPRLEMMAVAQPCEAGMGHGWRSGHFRR